MGGVARRGETTCAMEPQTHTHIHSEYLPPADGGDADTHVGRWKDAKGCFLVTYTVVSIYQGGQRVQFLVL